MVWAKLPDMSLEDEAVRRLRASAHPVRLRIMSLLTGAELSAAEVARELDVTQANASYHLRQLADCGLVEVASTEKVRGGVAKKYRYVLDCALGRSDDAARATSSQSTETFPMIAAALASELQRRAQHYRPRDADDVPNEFTDLETWIDPEVWGEVVELVQRASSIAHRNARPPRTEGAIPVTFISSLHRMRTSENGDS